MARGGINKAVVQTARLAILARGENPSITQSASKWAIPVQKPRFIVI